MHGNIRTIDATTEILNQLLVGKGQDVYCDLPIKIKGIDRQIFSQISVFNTVAMALVKLRG
jgi:hypothetical protein